MFCPLPWAFCSSWMLCSWTIADSWLNRPHPLASLAPFTPHLWLQNALQCGPFQTEVGLRPEATASSSHPATSASVFHARGSQKTTHKSPFSPSTMLALTQGIRASISPDRKCDFLVKSLWMWFMWPSWDGEMVLGYPIRMLFKRKVSGDQIEHSQYDQRGERIWKDSAAS